MDLTIISPEQLNSTSKQILKSIGCSYIGFHNYHQAYLAIQKIQDVNVYSYFIHVLVTIAVTGQFYNFITHDFC